jgi:hypothetical protein
LVLQLRVLSLNTPLLAKFGPEDFFCVLTVPELLVENLERGRRRSERRIGRSAFLPDINTRPRSVSRIG